MFNESCGNQSKSGTSPLRKPEAKAPEFSPLGTGAEVCFALASASDDTWSA